MSCNPLKWPSFEQLGRDFYNNLKPAFDQLASGEKNFDDKARNHLLKLQSWLDAPCVATVKLDGTNVGVDDAGLIVGRNTIVAQGETYQKVEVWSLLEGYPEKVAHVRTEIARAAGEEGVAHVMLYGELVVNSKHNYVQAGIFKQWLCFGVAVRPCPNNDEAASQLAVALRAAGFNASNTHGTVTIAPNAKLAALLQEIQVPTVAEKYMPAGEITTTQWAEHDGEGRLPCFRSLRRLLLSEWAHRFFLPANGVPLGEGLVIASEADGRLFKWKHAGEELGNVPTELAEAVETVRSIAGSPEIHLFPEGLLEVLERLLLVATTKPANPSVTGPDAKDKKTSQGDTQAMAVWESTLTKFDCLESVFERGKEAMKLMQDELMEQVAKDLVKDYGVSEKDARQRAARVVQKEMGQQFGKWKRTSQSKTA